MAGGHYPGWRKVARLKKGEEIVGSYADHARKLNPSEKVDPLDELQKLFREQAALAGGENNMRLEFVETRIRELSSQLTRARKL